MKRMKLGLLAAGLLFSSSAWAQDDAPDRGVARLSLINGDVSIRRGDSGEWVAAAINAPLVVEDHLLTGTGSRAELQFDWAHMLRLSSNTEVRLAELESNRYQAQLARGTVTLSVLRDSNADFELDTPSVSVRPKQRGDYRITVNDNGESEITVRSGEAEVFSPKGVETIRSGRTMLVRGAASDPEFQLEREIAYDNWDRWNQDRDHRLERSNSYRYVSHDIYGADDLDSYGRWIYVPPYGWVWSPYSVGPDWAPYRYGRWSWIDYYGWSWVDYAPWGWAPYHYGRWFWGAPYGWCWFPGPIYNRYYWRPALVAFFGFGGPGFGVGVGFGNVGWVPLAPYEPFYPWYGRRYYGGFRNGAIINNVTVVNNTNITNIYRNARIANGVTAIDSGGFVGGRGGRAVRITDGQLRSASLVQGPVPVAPSRASLRVSDRNVGNINLPRTEPARFYSRRPVPAIDRVPFEQQRRGMEQIARGSVGNTAQPGPVQRNAQTGNSPRVDRTETAPRTGAGVAGPVSRTGDNGWRRVGEAPNRASEPAVSRSQQGGRFGGSQPQTGSAAPPARIERTPESGSNTPRQSSDGWNRFGTQPRNSDSAAPRIERTPESGGGRIDRGSGNAPRQSNDGWNRFGTQPRSSDSTAPRVERTPETGRQNFQSGGNPNRFGGSIGGGSPRMEQRSEPRSMPRMESQAPIRINPPIVRERPQSAPAPRFERPSGGGGGGARMGGGGGMPRGESGGGARGGGGGGNRGGRGR